jgi:hypothetical protein
VNCGVQPPQAADSARSPCLHIASVAQGRCGGPFGAMMHSSAITRAIATAWVAWITAGCGEHATTESAQRHDESRSRLAPVLATNANGMVSIGVTDTSDVAEQKSLMQFFASNGIDCSLEGSVVYDAMVPQDQVEDARRLLQTNRPVVGKFMPAIDIGAPNPPGVLNENQPTPSQTNGAPSAPAPGR